MNSEPNLADLDHFLAADTFASAFQTDDQIVMENKSCVAQIGACDTFETTYAVTSVNSGQAEIVGKKPDGSEISDDKVAESDWNQIAHDYARNRISQMEGAQYKVTLVSLEPSTAVVQFNGAPQTVETRVLKLEGNNSAGMKYGLTLEIAAHLGALGQVLCETQDKGFGTDIFRVAAIKRKNHP